MLSATFCAPSAIDLDGHGLGGLGLGSAVHDLVDGQHAHVLQEKARCRPRPIVGLPLAFALRSLCVQITSTRSPGCTKPATPSTSSTRIVTAFMPSSITADSEPRCPGPGDLGGEDRLVWAMDVEHGTLTARTEQGLAAAEGARRHRGRRPLHLGQGRRPSTRRRTQGLGGDDHRLGVEASAGLCATAGTATSGWDGGCRDVKDATVRVGRDGGAYGRRQNPVDVTQPHDDPAPPNTSQTTEVGRPR